MIVENIVSATNLEFEMLMAPVLTPLILTLGPVGDLLRLPDKAAALSLPLSVRAHANRPGGSLRIVKFDRPGDASVNLYILVGPRTLVILDCERTALELQQLVARARGLDLPVEAIVLSHEHPDHGGAQVVRDAFPDAVLKALAAGADFVFVGRPLLFAAAAAGEPGVRHAITLLKAEIDWNMALLGICRPSDIALKQIRDRQRQSIRGTFLGSSR